MTDRKNHYFKTICFILTFSALIICALVFNKYLLDIISWINHLGWLAPVLFVLIYSLAAVMLLPTMFLTLAGGAIFGPISGTLVNLIGATCGAALGFLISRHLLFDWFSRQRGKRLTKLINGVEQRGWLFVALMRLTPIVPFSIVNYGLGVTAISFRVYLGTTFIFLIPAEIIYTFFGYAGMDALSKPENFYRNGGVLLTGLAILLFCIMKIIKTRQLSHAMVHNESVESKHMQP